MLAQTERAEPGLKEPWFALRVRSKYERSVSNQLRAMGYEEFAAATKVEKQWSDRVRTIEEFLFPGYVFCRVNPNDRLPVLQVRGVVHLVGFGGGPIAIPDLEIERVRAVVMSGLPVSASAYLELGQVVRIEKGPLAGLEGILESVRGSCRLIVSIQLLQRSISAEIERAWVRKVKTPGLAADIKSSRGSPPVAPLGSPKA